MSCITRHDFKVYVFLITLTCNYPLFSGVTLSKVSGKFTLTDDTTTVQVGVGLTFGKPKVVTGVPIADQLVFVIMSADVDGKFVTPYRQCIRKAYHIYWGSKVYDAVGVEAEYRDKPFQFTLEGKPKLFDIFPLGSVSLKMDTGGVAIQLDGYANVLDIVKVDVKASLEGWWDEGKTPGFAGQASLDAKISLGAISSALDKFNNTVADLLNISVSTVQTYRQRIMKKLNITKFTDLVKLVVTQPIS